jgi:plasmid maintenance system antidote protein VapI
MDSGNDSVDNLKVCYSKDTSCDFIIKRNLRKEKCWQSITEEDENRNCEEPRLGKKVYTGSVYRYLKEIDRKVRIVYKVIERTIKADGQILLVPEIEVETWWTSLDISDEEVIRLYEKHGTSEQFHSEIKTDMDLERLPSGYFDTNALVLELALMAYNILRIMGQESLKKDKIALKRGVQRRRLRTVIQNLITLASHVVKHARRIYLNLGCSNIWRFTFKRLYETYV